MVCFFSFSFWYAASDLGLHSVPSFLIGVNRVQKRTKNFYFTQVENVTRSNGEVWCKISSFSKPISVYVIKREDQWSQNMSSTGARQIKAMHLICYYSLSILEIFFISLGGGQSDHFSEEKTKHCRRMDNLLYQITSPLGVKQSHQLNENNHLVVWIWAEARKFQRTWLCAQ